MMSGLRWLLGVAVFSLSLLVSLNTHAEGNEQPSVFENEYTARLYGFSILATSRLSVGNEGIYEFYFNVRAMLGDITEISHFKWNAQQHYAMPLDYSYNRSGIGNNRDYVLDFDCNKNLVTNLNSKKSLAIAAAQRVQDNLTYQVQLRQDVIAAKTNLVYAITNGKETKDYHFEIVGEEILDTPLGKVNTVKIKRTQTNDNRDTYAWLAKDFQYLLVRLQQEENGSAYTIYISKASINGKAIDHF